jgi:uncharacterized protein (TIGR02246 family)
MKRGYVVCCAFGLFMLLAGCSEAPAPPADTSAADQKTIKDGETAWASDWAAKDLDKITGHYADDASVLVPDLPIMKGKDAIRSGMKDMLADKNLALAFATSDAVTSKGSDIAYTQGTYTLTMTNPKTKKAETESGKYVTVYKKQADGSWKAVEDINNADAPAKPVVMAKTKAVAKKAPAAGKKKKK